MHATFVLNPCNFCLSIWYFCNLQNRDYDDEDYVAGGGGITIKQPANKRLGGMPGQAGGLPRSSSDMSLAVHAGMDPRLNKRLKNQMAPKPGEPGQPRCACGGSACVTVTVESAQTL